MKTLSLPEMNTFVLSSSVIEKSLWLTCCKSLMKIRNNNGPNADPWGTPILKSNLSDFQSFANT